jgi:quercetin dioxygenase-like cupin family protein
MARAGPPSIAEGAQMAVLYGDLSKEGLFAMRLKLPAGYHIAPHTHPKPEIVTVISGTARLGMGDTAEREKAEVLPAGSFFAMPPA